MEVQRNSISAAWRSPRPLEAPGAGRAVKARLARDGWTDKQRWKAEDKLESSLLDYTEDGSCVSSISIRRLQIGVEEAGRLHYSLRWNCRLFAKVKSCHANKLEKVLFFSFRWRQNEKRNRTCLRCCERMLSTCCHRAKNASEMRKRKIDGDITVQSISQQPHMRGTYCCEHYRDEIQVFGMDIYNTAVPFRRHRHTLDATKIAPPPLPLTLTTLRVQ